MSTDMELSCDEKVIKEMGNEIKKAYSTSLLSLAVGRRILNGSPLAFGEGNVKGRIKNVLSYRKPAFWVVIAAVIAIIAASVCLLTNPQTISLPDTDSVQRIEMEQFNEGASLGFVTITDRDNIESVLSNMSGAKKSIWMSTNDYPTQNNYLIVRLTLEEERRTLCLYSKSGSYFIEEPYVGVYRSNREASVAIYKVYTGSINSVQPMTFSSDEGNLIKLGTIAFNEYMSSLTGEKTPVNERIATYKLNDISLLAGDINEFCVSVNYDYTTDNDGFVNPGDGTMGKGTWPYIYREIRVKNAGGYAYEIVSIGTGGGGQGLSPVEVSVSYSLIHLEDGEVLRAISPLSGDDAKLAGDIIMNHMIKSAVWPGVDINALEECYLLRTTYSDGTSADYYTYLLDGKAVMQRGANGLYSLIDDGLYEKLVRLVQAVQS